MYQQQLTQLLLAFNKTASRSYPINRLLNDSDYRNHCLNRELALPGDRLAVLVRQIRAVEDLLNHELRVDVIDPKHIRPTELNKKSGWLTAFGLCGLLVMLGSMWLTTEVKHQRLLVKTTHQAD